MCNPSKFADETLKIPSLAPPDASSPRRTISAPPAMSSRRPSQSRGATSSRQTSSLLPAAEARRPRSGPRGAEPGQIPRRRLPVRRLPAPRLRRHRRAQTRCARWRRPRPPCRPFALAAVGSGSPAAFRAPAVPSATDPPRGATSGRCSPEPVTGHRRNGRPSPEFKNSPEFRVGSDPPTRPSKRNVPVPDLVIPLRPIPLTFSERLIFHQVPKYFA